MNHELVARVFGGDASSAGRSVTTDSALTLSAAWACIRVLSETIGSLPWALYTRDAKGNAVRVRDHEVSEVLIQAPNDGMTNVEYRETVAFNLCCSGNAYSYIDRGPGGNLVSLTPIESSRVTPKLADNGSMTYEVRTNSGATEVLPREKVWHVKGFGRNGYIGLSPLSAARESMGFALATEEFGARYFAQGGKPGGTVTIPNFLTKEQREIARNNLQQMMGGMSNAHKFALFEGGMKPEPWGEMPLQDMEFLLLRQFNVQEVCRFYRVPPHMVADLARATFSNIEHQDMEFVKYALMPYMTRFEASVSRWLLKPEERGKLFLRFNFEGLLRADSKGRAEFYNSALQNGWMNRNEVREKENLNRVEDPEMDEYTVQANMMGIDDLGKAQEAKPAPAFNNPAPVKGDAIQHTNIEMGMTERMAEVLGKAMSEHLTATQAATVEEMRALQKGLITANENAARLAKEAARIARDSANSVDRALKENAEAVADATALAFQRSEAAIKELARVATMPRKAVFDDNGEPMGTIAVERLH